MGTEPISPQQVLSIPKDGRKSPLKKLLFKKVYRKVLVGIEGNEHLSITTDLLETKHVKSFRKCH